MRFLTFYEWKRNNPEIVAEIVTETGDPETLTCECRKCEGTGRVTCICPDCDDEHEHDCDDCEATGELDVSRPSEKETLLLQMYHKQLEDDKSKAKRVGLI